MALAGVLLMEIADLDQKLSAVLILLDVDMTEFAKTCRDASGRKIPL